MTLVAHHVVVHCWLACSLCLLLSSVSTTVLFTVCVAAGCRVACRRQSYN